MDPTVIRSILAKVGKDNRDSSFKLPLSTFEGLMSVLDQRERTLIEELLKLSPKALGFNGPFITMDEAKPGDLIKYEHQSFRRDGEKIDISAQYLPKPVSLAFERLRNGIKTDLGLDLMIESGYRSPAHQAITFLTYLEIFNYDIYAVAAGVALPGYSQHGDPIHTAIDVINEEGQPNDHYPQLFASTNEYAWLVEHAKEYGFNLSYPEGNSDGVKFEPWHWRYIG